MASLRKGALLGDGTIPRVEYATLGSSRCDEDANDRSVAKGGVAPSWLTRLVFGHARPLLDVGYSRQLDANDLCQLGGKNQTKVAYQSFLRSYKQQHHSMGRAMAVSYGLDMMACWLGSFVTTACTVFAPIVLQHVVAKFDRSEVDLHELMPWLGTLFLSRIVNLLCESHVKFHVELVLMRLAVSLKSLIFEKAMRRSMASKRNSSVADISNLFTADMDSILLAGINSSAVWVMPIQIAVVTYMLYLILDIAAFAGLGIILLSMLLNYLVTKGYMSAYRRIMTLKDNRMAVIKEVFGGIQIIKFNAWEAHAVARIRQWRRKEIRAITKYMYILSTSVFLFWCLPIFVSATSFAVYTLVLGKELTATKVFTALVLFNTLREPLRSFPDALQNILLARISLQRIEKYLATSEVHPERIARDVQNYAENVMISVEHAQFTWKPSTLAMDGICHSPTSRPILQDVDLKIYKGDFVVVHGGVGVGKSSLCAALLGELPSTRGKVFVRSESIAYYSQQPWIQNMTIRNNILFGLPFDARKYERVIDACSLSKDLNQLPEGDATEIGEKGVNLSGGQRARVALARACYSDAELYILDTPLAAVDAVVQSEIFNKCLCMLLESKTVILVTHNQDVIEAEAVNCKVRISPSGVVTVTRKQGTPPRRSCATMQAVIATVDTPTSDLIDGDKPDASLLIVPSAFVAEENRAAGRVSSDVIKAYIQAAGGWRAGIVCITISVFWQCFQVGSDFWLSHWTEATRGVNQNAMVKKNMTVYALLACSMAVLVLIRCIVTAIISVKASRFFFDELTDSLLHAPMRFFDGNPIGRIINRYSEDISTIDFRLTFAFFRVILSTIIHVAQFCATLYVVRYAGVLVLPLGYLYFRLGMFYVATSREISRLLKVSMSPILSHVSQSEQGVALLRAFGTSYVARAVQANFYRIDANNRVWFAQILVNQWFAVRVQMIGFAILVLVISSLILLREYLTPGLVGLAFMYAVNMDVYVGNVVRNFSALEVIMVSPERVLEYVGIPPEGGINIARQLPRSDTECWLQRGSISFENVVFAYKPQGDPVLKGISFNIQHNEKIGIVGRTGAGKSSLTMALFRINEVESGRIVIDGVDISTVDLHTLRSRMSIIPQVPVLFKGSMRAYMDPLETCSDVEIWQAFEHVGVKDMIADLDGKLDHEVSENGDNFSIGERQLLCLARALLRRSRVVVMDEATASIDMETEKKLQTMIQREFVDATVLTIAHRLGTVMESDRVLVMEDGVAVELDTPRRLARLESGIFRELAREGGYLAELLLEA